MITWNTRRACSTAAAVLVGSFIAFAAGCGGKAEEAEDGPASEKLPCDGELAEVCGGACNATIPCPEGLHCGGDNTCTADCTDEGGQCSGNCNERGYCILDHDDVPNLLGSGGNATGSAGVGSGGISSGGPGCIQQGIEFESLTPTVELLVDRSASMTANFGQQDRWNTIRDILVDPVEGFVKLTEAKVRFGFTLYTGLRPDEDTGLGGSCPDLIQVPIALNNYQAIADIFLANEVGDNTPTAESVLAVTTKLTAFQEIGPKVIVLATDGDPDSCIDPDSNGTEPPRVASEAAVQAAWDANISTYVIAVGDEIMDLEHMENLAQIGRGGDPNAHYYPAENANSLVEAFQSILGIVISCDFALNGDVEPGNAGLGFVAIDNTAVAFGDANGWDMPDTSTVRLLGASCDLIKLGASRLDIQFPCGTIDIR